MWLFKKNRHKKERLNNYNNFLQIKDSIHPHSDIGWKFSILSTEKYFVEKYKNPIIYCLTSRK